MEHTKVTKSFGCFPPKGLMLRLSSFRSKSNNNSNITSPTLMSPKSPKPSINNTNNREQEFRLVFARFDADNDGKISALELRSYFGSIGEYMSHQEAQGVIDELDTDGDGFIDFKDFMKLMKVNDDERDDMRAAFEMFEYEKGCGQISPKSLQKTLSRLGDPKTYDECLQMIKMFDTHGKGAVDFNEFQQMMTA
ncbi:putative EF-hand domain-containing protein [Helianthus annuus]|nr:putative EF-hand domain-containing protein [Helianthus annuus]KAJ0754240.1 putative EF-hand domain-containing protein [Helianthus annuus]